MALPLNPKYLAIGSAVAAVIVVGVVASSGYAVSVSNYDRAMDLAEQKIHNFMVHKVLDGDTDIPLSVRIDELRDRGFYRDMRLTIDVDGDVLRVPFTADLGYFSYDFDFDLVKASIGDEPLVKFFDLNSLTSLTATAHTDLLGGILSFTANASYLNRNSNYQDASAPELALAKDSLGFKDVGNATLTFSIDSQENIKSYIDIDSYLSDSVVITGLSASSEYQGLGSFKDFTSTKIAADKILCFGSGYSNDTVEKLQLSFDAVNKRKNGMFDVNYVVSSGKVDFNPFDTGSAHIQSLAINGKIGGLSLDLINLFSNDFASEFSPRTFSSVLGNANSSLSIDKGSHIIYNTMTKADKYAKPKLDSILFNLEGLASLSFTDQEQDGLQKAEIKFKADADRNLDLVYDGDDFIGFISDLFDNSKKNTSSLQFEYSESSGSDLVIRLNGKDL